MVCERAMGVNSLVGNTMSVLALSASDPQPVDVSLASQFLAPAAEARLHRRSKSKSRPRRADHGTNVMQNSSTSDGRSSTRHRRHRRDDGSQVLQRKHAEQNVYTSFPVVSATNNGSRITPERLVVSLPPEAGEASRGTSTRPHGLTSISVPEHHGVNGHMEDAEDEVFTPLSGTDLETDTDSNPPPTQLPILVRIPRRVASLPHMEDLSALSPQQQSPQQQRLQLQVLQQSSGPACPRSFSTSDADISSSLSSTFSSRLPSHHHPKVEKASSAPCPPPCGSQSGAESDAYRYLNLRLPKVSSEVDYERLARSVRGLEEGRFYYKDLDSNAARALLQHSPEGTFLVRDSSDPKFLFALTVKTVRGPTSVRVEYFRGHFQLDCEDDMKRKLPR